MSTGGKARPVHLLPLVPPLLTQQPPQPPLKPPSEYVVVTFGDAQQTHSRITAVMWIAKAIIYDLSVQIMLEHSPPPHQGTKKNTL